ncbi:MAG TPA: hypothetical protein VHF26_23530, partial [Trebonia sp.]|nr:hypothetical protein [Trebonia sp.]
RAAPNWYRAQVRAADGRVVLVGEDDVRVVFALRLVRRAMRACVSRLEALGRVRAAVLAAGLPGGVAEPDGPGPVGAAVAAVGPAVTAAVGGRVS